MKRFFAAIFMCIILTGCMAGAKTQESIERVEIPTVEPSAKPAEAIEVSTKPKEENIGDELAISRALVAKMLAMAYNDMNTVRTLDRLMEFSDVAPDAWYDRYINAVYTSGLMKGTGMNFLPEQPITLVQVRMLFDNIDPSNKVKFKIEDNTKDSPISYALWTQLYIKFLEGAAKGSDIKEYFGISETSFVVMATSANNSQLGDWNMITDRGPMTYVGLNMDAYVDKQIKVLEKDGDVIAVLSVVSQSPTIENAYIVNTDNMSVTIFSGGAERTYKYVNNLKDVSGRLCDIEINSGSVQSLTIFEQEFKDVILQTNDKQVKFEKTKPMDIQNNFKIYSIADGSVKWKGLNDLIVGTDLAKFIVKDGKLCGAVITEKPDSSLIRVAINTTDYNGLYHEKVTIKSDKSYTVYVGGSMTSYSANKELVIDKSMFENTDRVQIKSNGGLFQITSIKRNWPGGESPKYHGEFDVFNDERGYILVNIVGMEEYLYSVVPSEMPSNYGVEPSKAQAITARSYAYNQFFANRYHIYGANIDDSVSCQVYNNIPENGTSIEAVNQTKGQMLTYNGNVISANFFSTSSGMTANSGEVWANSTTKNFPTYSSEYMQAARQYSQGDYGDLTVEENAEKFFKSNDIAAYDSGFSWFRWTVEMTGEEIAASINANIKGRYEANSPLIKTLQEGNVYRSRPIDDIGELKDLEIIKRGEGGNIMQIKITGTKATVMVYTEYNVRALIKPYQYLKNGNPIITSRKDGSIVENYTIMPSAFYTIEKIMDEHGNLLKIKFYGGGNGHGAGMSQNGVKGMSDSGFSTAEILKHYYKGTEIKELY